MSQFRKKPVVVEAMQFRGPQIHDIDYFIAFDDWICGHAKAKDCKYQGSNLAIKTLEGTMLADPGDWIICGVKGELYPCKPDIFEATYEAVSPTP